MMKYFVETPNKAFNGWRGPGNHRVLFKNGRTVKPVSEITKNVILESYPAYSAIPAEGEAPKDDGKKIMVKMLQDKKIGKNEWRAGAVVGLKSDTAKKWIKEGIAAPVAGDGETK